MKLSVTTVITNGKIVFYGNVMTSTVEKLSHNILSLKKNLKPTFVASRDAQRFKISTSQVELEERLIF